MHRQKLYFTPEAKYSINLIYLYQNTVTESFKIIESSLHRVCTVFAPCLHRVSHRVCTVFGTVFAPCLNRVCTDFEPCFAPCLHRVCTVFEPCLTFHFCSFLHDFDFPTIIGKFSDFFEKQKAAKRLQNRQKLFFFKAIFISDDK